ncbi:MAG: hypothetical protein AAGB22_13475 [Bacteroidota bacterium]
MIVLQAINEGLRLYDEPVAFMFLSIIALLLMGAAPCISLSRHKKSKQALLPYGKALLIAWSTGTIISILLAAYIWAVEDEVDLDDALIGCGYAAGAFLFFALFAAIPFSATGQQKKRFGR